LAEDGSEEGIGCPSLLPAAVTVRKNHLLLLLQAVTLHTPAGPVTLVAPSVDELRPMLLRAQVGLAAWLAAAAEVHARLGTLAYEKTELNMVWLLELHAMI
jgi:hypothetical protein